MCLYYIDIYCIVDWLSSSSEDVDEMYNEHVDETMNNMKTSFPHLKYQMLYTMNMAFFFHFTIFKRSQVIDSGVPHIRIRIRNIDNK